MKLTCPDERVVIPRPTVLFEQLAHGGIVELETCFPELSLLIDAGASAL